MSKILLLSAGTRPESRNNEAAKIADDFICSELNNDCSLYDDFFENVPFLRDYNDDQPEYVVKVRDDLIEISKILIFSPVFNGGYVSHLKNLLDWLSLSFDDYSYNELFKDKSAAVISSVDGKGSNAGNAFNLLSQQLKNYGLNVHENFFLFNEDRKVEELKTNKKLKEDYFDFLKLFINS